MLDLQLKDIVSIVLAFRREKIALLWRRFNAHLFFEFFMAVHVPTFQIQVEIWMDSHFKLDVLNFIWRMKV